MTNKDLANEIVLLPKAYGVIGKIQPWQAHYDKFGRLLERTDWNAGIIKSGIPDTHHHIKICLPKGQIKPIDHIPDTGPNTNIWKYNK